VLAAADLVCWSKLICFADHPALSCCGLASSPPPLRAARLSRLIVAQARSAGATGEIPGGG
jgi:hypothetical protein